MFIRCMDSRGYQPTETCEEADRGIVKHNDCRLNRIGGVENPVPILTSIHPTNTLADRVRVIQTATSAWLKGEGVFPAFTHWQEGYGAFTVSHSDQDAVIESIKNRRTITSGFRLKPNGRDSS